MKSTDSISKGTKVANIMELPPWLKIENLIGNLNLSGWFKGWFRHENKSHIYTKTYIGKVDLHINKIEIISPSEYKLPTASTIIKDLSGLSGIRELKSSLEQNFSVDETFLIEKINRVHALNGRKDYDFRVDYGQALYHIRKRPSPSDWFVTAAVFISNSVPDGGIRNIFNCFEKISDPDKKSILDDYKKNLQTSYNALQTLRHADKKDDLRQFFLTSYEREILKTTEIPAERLEPLFKKFESDLLQIFQTYKLKDD